MKRRSGRTYDEVTDSARSEAGRGDENTAELKPQTHLTSGNNIIKLHMMRQKMFKPNVHAMIWVPVYKYDCRPHISSILLHYIVGFRYMIVTAS